MKVIKSKDAFLQEREQSMIPHGENLRKRQILKMRLQNYFFQKGLQEVETPILQKSPGLDVHIHAFETKLSFQDETRADQILYLHTSPEFAMKKLIAQGMTDIFQFAKVFRNKDLSPYHEPEFTLLEWYRSASLEDLMDDCQNILHMVGLLKKNQSLLKYTVQEVFQKYCFFDVLETYSVEDAANPTVDAIAQEARKLKIACSPHDQWEDVFYRIFLNKIEPLLCYFPAVIVCDYPLCLSALCKTSPQNLKVARRFELYVQGVELANAFDELNSSQEQLKRFQHSQSVMKKTYGHCYPIDLSFIQSVGALPDLCSGIALGFDRLVMLALQETHIHHVLWDCVAIENSQRDSQRYNIRDIEDKKGI